MRHRFLGNNNLVLGTLKLSFGGKNEMEDRLMMGYDNGAKCGDITCLQVLRKKGRGYEVVKTFYDEEAEELYKKLTEHN